MLTALIVRTVWALRSNNGTEFVATAVRDWLAQCDVQTVFMVPGLP